LKARHRPLSAQSGHSHLPSLLGLSPVAGLRVSYDALVRAMARMASDLPAADRDALFWRNAARFYRIAIEA